MKAIKPKWTALLASELLSDGRIYDSKAETVQEIASKNGISENTARRKLKIAVGSGQLEKVWRRIGTRSVPAYRVTSKSR